MENGNSTSVMIETIGGTAMDNPIRIEFDQRRNGALAYDGDAIIGECEYMIGEKGVWEIVHTGVREAYGGRGIAKNLVLCLIAEARKQGVKIRPICSYAAKMMLGKDEFKDVCSN